MEISHLFQKKFIQKKFHNPALRGVISRVLQTFHNFKTGNKNKILFGNLIQNLEFKI